MTSVIINRGSPIFRRNVQFIDRNELEPANNNLNEPNTPTTPTTARQVSNNDQFIYRNELEPANNNLNEPNAQTTPTTARRKIYPVIDITDDREIIIKKKTDYIGEADDIYMATTRFVSDIKNINNIDSQQAVDSTVTVLSTIIDSKLLQQLLNSNFFK